jgi:hypothetical protein
VDTTKSHSGTTLATGEDDCPRRVVIVLIERALQVLPSTLGQEEICIYRRS